MNVNIYMLFEEFSPDEARLVAEDKAQSLDIEGILFLSVGDDAPQSDHLYVCNPEEVLAFLYCGRPLCFAIVGDFNDYAALRKQGHSAIIFPKKCSIFSVFNRLQTAKERFDRWDDEMLTAIITKRPIKSVLEIGATRLSNPVAFFDKDFGLVMTAGEFPENVSGSIWEPVLDKGYSPPTALSSKQRTDIRDRFLESDWPFIYRSDILGEYHLCCSLLIAGVFFGSFGLSEFRPFTEGQVSILACLAKRMEQAITDSFGVFGTTVDMPYYLCRLFSGYDIEENVIDYHLRLLGWRSCDWFRVLKIEPTAKTSLSEEECAAYRNPIQSTLSDSIIFQYENAIVVIFHSPTPASLPESLTTQLEKHNLRAGVSIKFNYFMYIKCAYIQSTEVLAHGDGTLSFFEQHYTKCLLSTIGQITSLESLCHPGVLLEWQTGGVRGRLYISSIQVYLQNGRNLTDAAKKLNIHRNTLTYRIERISDIVGFDLKSDTIDDNLLLLLNFSCKIVMNLP